MCRHFVGTLSALCRVCAGSHNVHAGECVVLLARFDGTFQHTYDASAQRHQRIADRSPLSPEGCLLLFALRQSQHQPPALLLHRTKISPGIKGQIAAAVAGYFDVIGLLTSGQNNLTTGRVAAARRRFNRIRQVAPACTLIFRVGPTRVHIGLPHGISISFCTAHDRD